LKNENENEKEKKTKGKHLYKVRINSKKKVNTLPINGPFQNKIDKNSGMVYMYKF